MLRTPRDHRHTRHQGERGQVLVITGMLLAVLGGMAALAVDLGSYMGDRRELQNDADAIALAAAQELPSSAEVQAAANEWAEKNNIAVSGMTVTVIPQGVGEPNPKVRVELERDHSFTFARLVGIESTMVETAAAAIKTSPAGGVGIVPFSVQEDTLALATPGGPVVLKYDSNNISNGNTNPLSIDDPGAGNCGSGNGYCQGIMYGAEGMVCAQGMDPTYCTGPYQVDTETGNMVGPTRTAIDFRIDNTSTQCDTFAEVFQDDPLTNEAGVYRLEQTCNPFVSGGYASHRVLIVPVIETLCNGRCTVTIVDFALFFLEDFYSSCPGGGAGAGASGIGNAADSGPLGAGVLGDHNPNHNPPGQQTNTPTPTFTPVPPTNTPTPGPAPTPTPCNGNGNGNGRNACTGNSCEVIGRFVRLNQNIRLLAGTYDPNSANHFVRLVE